METQRLKNIIILILALLNLVLLVLLVNFRWRQNAAEQQLTERLYQLYEESGVGLAEREHLSLDDDAPRTLTLRRSLEQEAAMAAWLLEEEVSAEHQGGGIYTYTAAAGTVTFRSNGAFDYVPVDRDVSSPAEFCDLFCQTFGYRPTRSAITADSGSLSAERQISGICVYNGTVSCLFEQGQLLSLSGFCLTEEDSAPLSAQYLSAADALVKFLDYRKLSGAICSAVTDVERVYDLHSAGQTPSLNGKWQVSTDTYRYYVDCTTGEISRG